MDATVKAKGRSCWTWEQNKAFELALATYKDNCIDRWQKVAASVPGKTVEEIKHQYKLLVEDINNIESDLVPLPNYKGLTDHFAYNDTNIEDELHVIPCKKGKGPKEDQERRKGQAWSLDEHRLFLLGLEKYGKGDWRSISRNYVLSRTPAQVASHAQKYFIKQKSMMSMNRRTGRASILNITDAESITSALDDPIDLPNAGTEDSRRGMFPGSSTSTMTNYFWFGQK